MGGLGLRGLGVGIQRLKGFWVFWGFRVRGGSPVILCIERRLYRVLGGSWVATNGVRSPTDMGYKYSYPTEKPHS